MNVIKARTFSLEEMRDVYRSYLQSCNLGKNTIQTSSNDTFYLWRNVGQATFWDAVFADDFEDSARNALLNALKENSKGNPDTLVNSYMSHLRRFRNYILSSDISDQTTVVQETQKKTPMKKKDIVNVPVPCVDQVEYYLKQWEALENYHLQEDALDKLFLKLCPENMNISDILIKVATLNDFYSTNIFSVYPVAKHIFSLNIDNRLKVGDVTLVNDVMRVTINGKVKDFYSFATKYCSHHNPLDYPIYDSYVEKVLIYFRNRDSFSDFTLTDLKDYVCFKGTLIDFRKFYGLEQYNLKLIDKYIWQLGKEYFPKNYGKK